jgi:myosin-5
MSKPKRAWYYVDLDGNQQGPVDESTLKSEYRTGELDGLTLMWRPGQKGGWMALDKLSSLKGRITQSVAPAAPAVAAPPPLSSPQASSRRSKPSHALQPRSSSKKAAPSTSTNSKRGHKSALTFSQEAQFDVGRFAESKQAKEDQRMAKIREIEAAEAAAGDVLAQERRAAAEKMKQELLARRAAQHKSGWDEHFTPERLPYYQNRETGDLSWEKPMELRTAEELETADGVWLWMPDKKEAFLPGKVVSRNGGKIQATGINGQSFECEAGKEAGVITNFHSINMREDDLVQMLDVNEGSIINCLRERFKRDLIYTAVGDILIALNPYVRLPLYTPEKVYEYSHRGTRRLPPHVFDTASRTYLGMCEYHKDYSILISGESGAGKTEATKQVLIYLSEVAGSSGGGSNDIAQRVLSANPGLEAFGNAKTLRNNNSSRFGKFMQVYFNAGQKIAGCQIENYLLEKSRVVMQLEGERNFHIFYMLCVATTTKVRAALRLENPQDYHYLNQSGCIKVDGMDDVREFEDVMTALKKLEFSEDEIMNMWNVAAAVLHCGNIKFDATSSEACSIHKGSQESVQNLADLLQIDVKRLSKTFVIREITMRGETVRAPLNVERAIAGRDALSKSLYGHLFDWLVVRTNKAMIGSGNITSGNYIGILDIFGFEIFKSNSFEQLCINFCNEKLQQHFNRNTFVLEEDTYKAEGIDFDHIEYIDNQDILNMIEKKPKGILVVLDDEVSVPKGSDRGFYNKICKIHKKNKRFLQPRLAQNTFVINHYAGGVTYTIDNMMEKNKDKIEEDMAALMTTSKLSLVGDELYASVKKEMEQKKKGGSASRGSRYLRTQSSVFRSSLNALMKRLNGTTPGYIRCIKTNAVKKPGVFTAPMCLEQLRYAGVFEGTCWCYVLGVVGVVLLLVGCWLLVVGCLVVWLFGCLVVWLFGCLVVWFYCCDSFK